MTEFSEEEIAAVAVRLDAFPAQAGAAQGVVVPIFPESKRPWAIQLLKRGLRFHEELAEEFPVVGDQPGMGDYNPSKWVSREEYEARTATTPTQPSGPTAETVEMETIASLLESVDPVLAEQIRTCPPDQVPALREELGRRVPGSLAGVKKVRAEMGVDETPTKTTAKTARKRAPAKKTTAKKATRKKAQ